MAEERSESLQMELENCREKLEEATLDLQLMRAEMEAGGNTREFMLMMAVDDEWDGLMMAIT